jgi:hypothetical protein
MQSLGLIIVIVNQVDIQCLLHDLVFTSELRLNVRDLKKKKQKNPKQKKVHQVASFS